MSRSLRELYESSPFSSAQAPYVEEQYERFLADPASVSAEWREFFGPFGTGARPQPAGTAPDRPAPTPAQPSAAAPAHPTPTSDAREAVVGLAPDPVLREPRPPHRRHRPARPHAAPDAARARSRLRGPDRGGHGLGVLHREPHQRRRQADEAVGDPQAAAADLHGPHRRRIRARLDERGAALAPGPLPGRAAPPSLRQRRAPEPALAAHGGRGPRALPAHALRRPEALLARGRRRARSRSSTTSCNGAEPRASRKS